MPILALILLFLNEILHINAHERSVCLNMIVRNEIDIIQKCFDSLVDYIDYWVICDSGSNDGTQLFINEYFSNKGINGKLINITWKNFGESRTEGLMNAYKYCDSEYILLSDADMELRINDIKWKEKLSESVYLIKQENAFVSYWNIRLLNLNDAKEYGMKYVGVTHEYLETNMGGNGKRFDGIEYFDYANGHNRGNKTDRDIALLKQGIIDEPGNSRYKFYLANTYRDISDFRNCVDMYNQALKQLNWNEEIYQSLYGKGLCMEKSGYYDLFEWIAVYLKGFMYHKHRLETLYRIVKYCRIHGNEEMYNLYELGWNLGKMGLKFDENDNYIGSIEVNYDTALFMNKDIHYWQFKDEMAVLGYYNKKYNISYQICDELLNSGYVAESEIERIKQNRKYAKEFLAKKSATNSNVIEISTKEDDSHKEMNTFAHDIINIDSDSDSKIATLKESSRNLNANHEDHLQLKSVSNNFMNEMEYIYDETPHIHSSFIFNHKIWILIIFGIMLIYILQTKTNKATKTK